MAYTTDQIEQWFDKAEVTYASPLSQEIAVDAAKRLINADPHWTASELAQAARMPLDKADQIHDMANGKVSLWRDFTKSVGELWDAATPSRETFTGKPKNFEAACENMQKDFEQGKPVPAVFTRCNPPI